MTGTTMLTPREVSAELKVGRTKTWGLIRSGAIKSVKVGRLRRVPRCDLEDSVRSLRETAAN